MGNLSPLISDLAVLLASGAIIGLIFQRLGQPLIVGYLLAGYLISPQGPLTVRLVEHKSIEILGELGIILILFYLGLEFSLKRLIKLGPRPALIGLVEVTMTAALGFVVARQLGASQSASFFIGSMVAISSTGMILKGFEDSVFKNQPFTKTVIGILIVEDIFAIGILLVLTTLAGGQNFEGLQLSLNIFQLMLVVLIWGIAGLFFVPPLFDKARKWFSDEILLIAALSLCLIMVAVAHQFKHSTELAAFLMGSILAETRLQNRIVDLIKPLRDLFGAIFFISIGLLIAPETLIANPQWVIALTLTTLACKFLFASSMATITGGTLSDSAKIGFSLSQIGEFSFIIAGLGLHLGAIDKTMASIIVMVSFISSLIAPNLLKHSDSVLKWASSGLPNSWLVAVDNYRFDLLRFSLAAELKRVAIKFLPRWILNASVVIAIFWFFKNLDNWAPSWQHLSILKNKGALVVGAAIVSLPFLWAMMFYRRKDKTLPTNTRLFSFDLVRLVYRLITLIFLLVVSYYFFEAEELTIVTLVLVGSSLFLLYSPLESAYHRVEGMWFASRSQNLAFNQIRPWKAEIEDIKVEANSNISGKTLLELSLRSHLGITLLRIQRGHIEILSPSSNERIFPFDILSVLGSNDQIEKFREMCLTSERLRDLPVPEPLQLTRFIVGEESPLGNKLLKELVIFKDLNLLVVGIERKDRRILNPIADTQVLVGDGLWLAGKFENLKKLEGER
ncbi:MAG: hypothetical protein COT74_13005 [Bdellovibrionales bacterium CG10_big_fil_rev_8_21_14_0_10_45_34]|nr:MAG: hypothetical protein COT74_13005 [Bdellovibrionales bacterium CG10_big_fil_rev_8_21_14_0_10_45_34]